MSTTGHIDNHPAGIATIIQTKLASPWDLGHWLTSRPSDEQAALLHGLQTGFKEMGGVTAGIQLRYIRDAADHAGFDLSILLAMLNDHLGEQAP